MNGLSRGDGMNQPVFKKAIFCKEFASELFIGLKQNGE
jgi:hypothetical protein